LNIIAAVPADSARGQTLLCHTLFKPGTRKLVPAWFFCKQETLPPALVCLIVTLVLGAPLHLSFKRRKIS